MAKKNRWERAWIQKKIDKGVPQGELLESIGIFSNRKKKRVMEQKGLSSKQYEKRKEFLGNAYVLLSNEKFKPKPNSKPKPTISQKDRSKPRTGIVPRTERSAFRSREYTYEELSGLYDNIDDINF